MKRTPLGRSGKPLKRSPLRPKTPLKAGSARLTSNSSLQKKAPLVAKEKVRGEQEILCRQIVAERSQGVCEICGSRQATDMAHRLAVSQNGKWNPSNLLHACRQCHSYNHDHPQNSFDHGWHLRSGSNSLEEEVLLTSPTGKKDWFFLTDDGKKILTNKEN